MVSKKQAGGKVTSKLKVKHNKLVIFIDGVQHIPVPLDCLPLSYVTNEKYYFIDYYTKEHGVMTSNYTRKDIWLAVLAELEKHNI